MKRYQEFLLVFTILFLTSVFLHRSYLNEFPRYIHAWTQSDRYALALGFTENGLDPFHPQTFNLRPDPFFKPVEETGITPVDPPIPEYLVASVMKLTGSKSPAIFRVYSILVSCLGISFLYLLLKEKNVHLALRTGVLGFVFFSPVFFYYSSGFIPSVTAVAATFSGIYFFYSDTHRNRTVAIILFLSAAMVRAPFVAPLIIAGLIHFREERKWKPAIAAFFVLLAVFLWNQHLGDLYGSLFLRKLMHARNLEELTEYFNVAVNNWKFTWFTGWHYLFFVSILLMFLFLRKKDRTNDSLPLFTSAWLFFSAVYYVLMQSQFQAHDYYFLDSFFVPLVLLVVYLTSSINTAKKALQAGIVISVLIFVSLAAWSNHNVQQERRTTGSWDRTDISCQNFSGGESLLDSLKVPKDARILVLDGYTINAPLILLNRKGYSIINTKKDILEDALDWNYDYVVMQDEFILSDIVKPFPGIVNRLKKIGGNGKISVFKRSADPEADFATFFGLSKDRLLAEIKTDSCLLDRKTEFGCAADIPSGFINGSDHVYVIYSADVQAHEAIKDIQLTCNAGDGSQHTFYRSFQMRDYIDSTGVIQNLSFLFVIPRSDSKVVKAYAWNPGADDNVLMKNVSVKVYR